VILGVDVDGVLNDLHRDWVYWYNGLTGDHVDPNEWRGWGFEDFPGDGLTRDEFYSFLCPETYRSDAVLPYSWAADELRVLRACGHRLMFVTACGRANRMAAAKFEWLMRHDLFQAGDLYRPAPDKSLAPCEILFDDGMHNLRSFHGPAVKVVTPQNADVEWYPHIVHFTATEVVGAIDRVCTELSRTKANSTN